MTFDDLWLDDELDDSPLVGDELDDILPEEDLEEVFGKVTVTVERQKSAARRRRQKERKGRVEKVKEKASKGKATATQAVGRGRDRRKTRRKGHRALAGKVSSDVKDYVSEEYGILGALAGAAYLKAKHGSVIGGVKEERKSHNARRVARLVGKMAKLHEKGETDKAKKIGAKLLKVVSKMQKLDPSYRPSKKVQSWLDWAVSAAITGKPGKPGSSLDDYDYAPDDDDFDWEGDVDWAAELEGLSGMLAGQQQGYQPGYQPGYQQGYQQGYQPSYQDVGQYRGPHRSAWEDPNVFVATPGPGWGGGTSSAWGTTPAWQGGPRLPVGPGGPAPSGGLFRGRTGFSPSRTVPRFSPPTVRSARPVPGSRRFRRPGSSRFGYDSIEEGLDFLSLLD